MIHSYLDVARAEQRLSRGGGKAGSQGRIRKTEALETGTVLASAGFARSAAAPATADEMKVRRLMLESTSLNDRVSSSVRSG